MSFRDHLIGFILRARQIRGQVDDLEAEIVKGETKGGFQGMKHQLEFERRKLVGCAFFSRRTLFSKHPEKIYTYSRI